MRWPRPWYSVSSTSSQPQPTSQPSESVVIIRGNAVLANCTDSLQGNDVVPANQIKLAFLMYSFLLRTEPVAKEPLRIVNFNVLTKKNEKVNNTAVYDTDKLVLRRGNDFSVRFILSRAFDKKTDALNVEFRRGSNPQFREGTRFECLVERRAVREWEWKGTIKNSEGNEVNALLHIPVDAPIGEYEVIAEAVDLETQKEDTKEAHRNVVILFNPWDKGIFCQHDYVLCTTIYMYRYTCSSVLGCTYYVAEHFFPPPPPECSSAWIGYANWADN